MAEISKLSSNSLFRHADGVIPNMLAILYAVGGYGVGLALCGLGGGWWPVGVLLLASSLVVAAFLIHECTHQTLFAVPNQEGEPDRHVQLATALAWITGACYSDYRRIRDKHLRHHVERADIVALDYRALLGRHPLLRRLVEIGQWLCLPAVELLFHALVLVRPFMAAIAPASGASWSCWRCAPVVLRLVRPRRLVAAGGLYAGLPVVPHGDGLHGRLPAPVPVAGGAGCGARPVPTLDRTRFPAGYFSRDYEDSTPLQPHKRRFPVLNLLVLNFCYHNVHHRRPTEPWYRLPVLERTVSRGPGRRRVVPFAVQLRDFFRYRVARVMAPAADHPGSDNTGAAGVSFLTAL